MKITALAVSVLALVGLGGCGFNNDFGHKQGELALEICTINTAASNIPYTFEHSQIMYVVLKPTEHDMVCGLLDWHEGGVLVFAPESFWGRDNIFAFPRYYMEDGKLSPRGEAVVIPRHDPGLSRVLMVEKDIPIAKPDGNSRWTASLLRTKWETAHGHSIAPR